MPVRYITTIVPRLDDASSPRRRTSTCVQPFWWDGSLRRDPPEDVKLAVLEPGHLSAILRDDPGQTL
jgi:hypothetical protein